MSLRWLIAVFLYLIPTTSTTVLSLSDLEGRAARISLKDNNPTESHQEQLQEQQQDNVKICGSPLSLEAIIKQGDALRASTLVDNINDVVRKLDSKLSELIDSGVSPLDATSIINSFFNDARDLVLTAIKVKAFTLLKLLQIIYIWRDKAQFHWFQALGYESEWYDKTFWCIHPMNWRDNIQAICEWNNAALILKVQKDILSDDVSPEDILNFNKEVWMLCIKYDAIKVFEALQFDPIQLGLHLELLATRSSAKLLSLYQTTSALEHLHLERFPFPEKLAASVREFKFLMKHGQNFFPMSRFIGMFCEKGRLDLLKYLHSLEKTLLPNHRDLEIVARKGWINILKWAHHLGLIERVLSTLAIGLASNHHFQALDWLVKVGNTGISLWTIRVIVCCGDLEALIWINERQPLVQDNEMLISLAAGSHQLSILKWFYETFKLLPTVSCLGDATIEMLEWIKITDNTLINASLVEVGIDNFELLQWVQKNAPALISRKEQHYSLVRVHSREMMIWLYEKLNVCTMNMDWAYKAAGDLEAIQWAANTCYINPTLENTYTAARNGHIHIIDWIYTKCYQLRHELDFYDTMLNAALESKDFKVASHLVLNVLSKGKRYLNVDYAGFTDQQHVSVLEWAMEHKIKISRSYEMEEASKRGNLQAIKWIAENFPRDQPESKVWKVSAEMGRHEIYKWLLERYPKKLQRNELCKSIKKAYEFGHFEVVKVILKEDPSLVEDISKLEVTSSNYHINQWLITNGK